MGFPGAPMVKNPPANVRDTGSTPNRQRSPREGNDNPFPLILLGKTPWTETCLATVHRV